MTRYIFGTEAGDSLNNFSINEDQFVWAGGGADYVQTGAGADTVYAGTGNDLADGGFGSDNLFGDEGNDTLKGGGGADALDGGADNDTASYAYSTSGAGVRVDLVSGKGYGGDAQGDTLVRIENITGSMFNDFLYGDSGANVLNGGAQVQLASQPDLPNGDDYLEGGGGADILIGGPGSDTAGYSRSASGVSVNLDAGSTSGGDAAGDQFSGIENIKGSAFEDWLTGDAGANKLEGGAGIDHLKGGGGSDVLMGGAGKDYLTGGEGTDTFAIGLEIPGWFYTNPVIDSGITAATRDVISDFVHGVDRIDVSAIDASNSYFAPGDQSFSWIGTGSFSGASGQLQQTFDGGNTIIEGDINGDRIADFQVELIGIHYLSAYDFIL
jgi:Ca2+-binding RTX toxin-like protein